MVSNSGKERLSALEDYVQMRYKKNSENNDFMYIIDYRFFTSHFRCEARMGLFIINQ